jgi:hypothetical protein
MIIGTAKQVQGYNYKDIGGDDYRAASSGIRAGTSY